ncbi:hypothetical protein BH24ACT21_BH24ACT21_06220 [soil metagenome]
MPAAGGLAFELLGFRLALGLDSIQSAQNRRDQEDVQNITNRTE